ncbi:peptidoglycan DD-metalloendopeptidase family protein [Nocardioides sp. YIM 152588]|uniref:M23 family metallopeptidase n=1 Tax=Nocardioides sp. YIM 152588 TaxID=3158259 RepID=UPI0032E4C46D
MRSFPSARRLRPASRALPARYAAACLAVVVALVCVAVPAARADDDTHALKKQQKQVQGQIHKAHDHLEESSRRVTRISRRLDTARGQLQSARSDLVRVRGDLAEARLLKQRLAARLERAEARFETAVEQVRAAREDVADQRDVTRDTVIGIATGGNPELAMVSSYLNSGSVEEIMINETGNGVVVGREQHVLEDLVEAEEALEDHRDEVRAARNEVAASKRAAQQNLSRVRVLVGQARDSREKVAVLVTRTRDARHAAVRAREKDRAALKRLEKREQRIKQQILEASRKQSGSYSGSTGGLLHVPASGPVTSPYGYRTHPIYGYYALHNGTDFGAPCGSSLWAGASGTVVNEYYDEVYGYRLYLAIGRVNGAVITLVYNHLSRYAVGVGARVSRGQVVGYVGTTGWSTGCHLHFTVLKNGNPVNPMSYL